MKRERILWAALILIAILLLIGGSSSPMDCDIVLQQKVKTGSFNNHLQYDPYKHDVVTIWTCEDGRGPGKLARIERTSRGGK